jgi:hypothetical protein
MPIAYCLDVSKLIDPTRPTESYCFFPRIPSIGWLRPDVTFSSSSSIARPMTTKKTTTIFSSLTSVSLPFFILVVEMMTIFEIEGSPHDDRRPTVCPALVWSGQFSAKRKEIK